MNLSGRFILDARAPKPPLEYRVLAAALRAHQAETPTARVVAAAPETVEHGPRTLARQVAGPADADR